MSKKAKGVVLGQPLYLSKDDTARLKHQALFQEYQDLQKETFDMRMKLDAAKQRRKALSAEVRFLQRRRKYLLKIKSLDRTEEHPQNIANPNGFMSRSRKSHKREATQFKVPPLPGAKSKGTTGKGIALKHTASAFDLNQKLASQSGKDASHHSSTFLSDVNYRKRASSGNDASAVYNIEPTTYSSRNENLHGGNGSGSKMPAFDLNLDSGVGRKDAVFPSRAPTFDLNEVSMEEEELPVDDEAKRFEESNLSLFRGSNDEQASDMKISVCRNAGEGPSRIGKRKISWQDPVALRV